MGTAHFVQRVKAQDMRLRELRMRAAGLCAEAEKLLTESRRLRQRAYEERRRGPQSN